MIKLRLLLLGLIIILAACSNNPEPTTPEITSEATAEAALPLELSETYTFDLGWGGQAAFDYPSEWDVRVQQGIGIYGTDGYNVTISADNNPTANNDAQSQLDRLNQSNDILTTEVNGLTLYYSFVPMSNRYTITVQIDEHTYGVLQLVNTRSRDLEPMLDTVLQIAASMRLVD